MLDISHTGVSIHKGVRAHRLRTFDLDGDSGAEEVNLYEEYFVPRTEWLAGMGERNQRGKDFLLIKLNDTVVQKTTTQYKEIYFIYTCV